MNKKEIISSALVLILIFGGLFMLMIFKGNKSPAKNPGDTQGAATLTTDAVQNNTGLQSSDSNQSGFAQRAQNQPQQNQQQAQTPQTNNQKSTQAPAMELKSGVDYKTLIKTSMGDIKIDLFEKDTPVTVNNFVVLAKKGFYNNLIFHRVIEDFMIQGGDPTGTGAGGPGYSFQDEITPTPLVKGSLAMANAGPNTNGSQFFIVTKESVSWLNGKHTNFGQVLEGQDIAEAISKVQTDTKNKPVNDVVIKSIEIIEN